MGFVKFTEETLLDSPLLSHGDKIIARRTDTTTYPDPEQLYLIYFGIDAATRLDKIVHLKSDLIQNDFGRTALDLLTKARNYRYVAGQPFPTGIVDLGVDDRIIWKEPTYLCLVLDVPGVQWAWGPLDPITFNPVKFDTAYDENYSFYNAIPTTVGGLPAVRLGNYFKKDSSGAAIGMYEKCSYSMNFNVIVPTLGDEFAFRAWDPDSDNEGPGGLTPL